MTYSDTINQELKNYNKNSFYKYGNYCAQNLPLLTYLIFRSVNNDELYISIFNSIPKFMKHYDFYCMDSLYFRSIDTVIMLSHNYKFYCLAKKIVYTLCTCKYSGLVSTNLLDVKINYIKSIISTINRSSNTDTIKFGLTYFFLNSLANNQKSVDNITSMADLNELNNDLNVLDNNLKNMDNYYSLRFLLLRLYKIYTFKIYDVVNSIVFRTTYYLPYLKHHDREHMINMYELIDDTSFQNYKRIINAYLNDSKCLLEYYSVVIKVSSLCLVALNTSMFSNVVTFLKYILNAYDNRNMLSHKNIIEGNTKRMIFPITLKELYKKTYYRWILICSNNCILFDELLFYVNISYKTFQELFIKHTKQLIPEYYINNLVIHFYNINKKIKNEQY